MVLPLIFIMGIILGSAANALIDRLPRKESWFSGRSHCDKCNHPLSILDLIPVISFLWLQGKCRYCQVSIPYRNLFVELLMGIGFVSLFILHSSLYIYPVLWLTVIIAFMDWETQLVSEVLVLMWGVFIIIEKYTGHNLQSINNLIGICAGVAIIGGIWAISRGRAMGFGDVEIVSVMGFWLGWPNIFWAIEIAFISGAIVGLLQILRHKNKLKGKIAFGTFLILGTWVAYLL